MLKQIVIFDNGGIMKLSEFINKIFNKNLKKLSSGNIVETKIIPIIFKNKDDEIIANYIADDINKNIELYKIFLKEYNAINIGDIDNKNDKTLKLKHCFDKILFKNEKKFKGSLRINSILLIEDELRKMYQNRFKCLDIAWLKENIKGNSSFILIGGTIENELYWNITKYIENDKLYLNCLSSLKDMDGLELLLKSKDTKEFLTKYNEKNALKLLNWAVEVSTDHTYDNFFLKNLDIIDEAIQHTKYDAKDDINAVLNGERFKRLPGNVNFSFGTITGANLVKKLNEEGICASSGSACSSGFVKPSHVLLGMRLERNRIETALRITIGKNNTKEDIEKTIQVIKKYTQSKTEN